MKSHSTLRLIAVAQTCLLGSLFASEHTWVTTNATGGPTLNWHDTVNWSPASVPNATDANVTMGFVNAGSPNVLLNGAYNVNNLNLAANGGNTLTLQSINTAGTYSLTVAGTIKKNLGSSNIGFQDYSSGRSFSLTANTLDFTTTGGGSFFFGRSDGGRSINSVSIANINMGAADASSAAIRFNVTNNYSLGLLTFSGTNTKTVSLINNAATAAGYARTATVKGITQTGGTAATIEGSFRASASGTNAATLQIDTDTATSFTASTVLANGTGGTLAITKQGSGSQTLSGVNTYTGATTISAGKLTIASTGTINATSGVSIGAGEFNYNSSTALTPSIAFSGTGGTLSGSGTVGALTLTSGNTISPGNSPGTLTTGNEIWNGGATYVWEINNATGTQGTNWDFISSTGSLDISALSASSKFNVNVVGLTAGNVSGAVPNWVDGSASWKIASFTSITGTFTSDLFNVDAGGFTNHNTAAGAFSVTNVGNDLYLTYAIPEPSTYAALAGALALVGTTIRRRRR